MSISNWPGCRDSCQHSTATIWQFVICCVTQSVWEATHFHFYTLGPGSWILDPRLWIQDPGSWVQDLDPGPQIQDHASRIVDPGPWIQDPGSWILDPGSSILEPVSWIQYLRDTNQSIKFKIFRVSGQTLYPGRDTISRPGSVFSTNRKAQMCNLLETV